MSVDLNKFYHFSRDSVLAVKDGNICYTNPSAALLFGAGLEGRVLCEVLPGCVADFDGDEAVSCTIINNKPYRIGASKVEDLLILNVFPESEEAGRIALGDSRVDAGINSALCTLRMAADVLSNHLKKGNSQRSEGYLAALYHSYYKVLRLTNGMAFLRASLESNAVLELSSIELSELCADLVQTVRIIVRPKNVNVEYNAVQGHIWVMADKNKLEVLLLNLISNSLQSVKESGTITIGLKKLGSSAMISVEDDGSGIPESKLPYLFTGGKNEKLTDMTAGAGLGLRIASGIARQHNGTLVIESREDQGTRARFVLPCHEKTGFRFSDAKIKYHAGDMNNVLMELSDVLDSSYYNKRYLD